MPENNKIENNNTLDTIKIIVGILLTLTAILYVILAKQPEIKTEVTIENENESIITPSIDQPTTSTPITLLSTRNLLTSDYIPSEDVYTENYEKESIKLSLNGQFEKAIIEVDGEVFGEGKHFISFNIDDVTGVLNAARKSENQLDLDETKKLGGVFVKGNQIKLSINLLDNTVLSTTKEEFINQNGEKVKKVIIMDKISPQPPTVVRLLFAPFNEYGKYGGAVIKNIEFKYLCKDGHECGAELCPSPKMYTECLENSFGRDSAIDWCNKTNLTGCEALTK